MKILDRLEEWLVTLLMGGATVIVFVAVMHRYFAGVAIPVDVRERYADAVQGYTRGTISVVSTMSATEALSSAVKMSANIVAQFTAAERLAAEAGAIKNLRAALTSADSLAAAVQGSTRPVSPTATFLPPTALADGTGSPQCRLLSAPTSSPTPRPES